MGLAASAIIITFMVVWPQLRYRPEERALTFDADGLSFERGEQSGRMPWGRIGSVTNVDRGIVVAGRTGNAFIVPTRAFGGEAEKAEAFRTISRLYRQAA